MKKCAAKGLFVNKSAFEALVFWIAIITIASIFVLLGSVIAPASEPKPQTMLSSVVKIETPGGWGSGVAVGSYELDGYRHTLILTAAHVVGQFDAIKLHIGDKVQPAIVLKRDKDLDLALVETTQILPVVKLARSPQFCEPIWVIGFPMADGEAITSGFLSSASKDGIEASASVYPGNSGGALLVYHDGNFELAGIVDSLRVMPAGLSAILVSTDEYSVDLDHIRKFLAS